MSMYRQLWLAIIISTLLALTGGLLSSTLSARTYLLEQLHMKNSDNASALALSLSRSDTDTASIELAVAALFDSGHYELIRVIDPHGKVISERIAPEGRQEVPAWFAKILPITPQPGYAEISTGWKRLGTVTLASHSRFAYRSLWNSVTGMVIALSISGLVGGYLGSLILRRLRKPLHAVIGQAQAITERRFVTIAEPRVQELRKLASAMNTTVFQLKGMFEEEAARLEIVRKETNTDPLTGLANRSYFMAKLHGMAEGEEAEAGGGSLILIRVANLGETNRHLGRSQTDELLKLFSTTISICTANQSDVVSARLNGADFAVLLPGEREVAPIAENLLQMLERETAPYFHEQPCAYIGTGAFSGTIEMGGLLAQVDAALAAAELDGVNGIRKAAITTDEHAPKSAEDWSRLIQNALDQHWVKLISFPVIKSGGGILHWECPVRLKFDAKGEWQPAGKFLPVAERLRLTPQLDFTAITLGIEMLQAHPELPGLAINVSANSINDKPFRADLKVILARAPEASRRLWLEVAESGALRHFEAFRDFCQEMRETHCKLGLEHFGHQFSQVGRLHDLGLDYLKIDSSFVRDIHANPGNQAFLKGLTSIAHAIGLQVLAEGVVNQQEAGTLEALGLDGLTGPVIKDQQV